MKCAATHYVYCYLPYNPTLGCARSVPTGTSRVRRTSRLSMSSISNTHDNLARREPTGAPIRIRASYEISYAATSLAAIAPSPGRASNIGRSGGQMMRYLPADQNQARTQMWKSALPSGTSRMVAAPSIRNGDAAPVKNLQAAPARSGRSINGRSLGSRDALLRRSPRVRTARAPPTHLWSTVAGGNWANPCWPKRVA